MLGSQTGTAKDAEWDGGGTDDNWSTNANWGKDLPANNRGVVFTDSSGLTNTNDLVNLKVKKIKFEAGAGAFVLGGNAIDLSGDIENKGTSPQTVDLDITLLRNIKIKPESGDLAMNGDISGNFRIEMDKDGGTVTLSGNNSFTEFRFKDNTSGILKLASDNALGTADIALKDAQNGKGNEVQLAGGITTGTNAITLNGTGYQNADTGALRNISGNNTWAGAVTLSGDSRINSDSGTLTLSNAGAITDGDGADLQFGLTVGGAGDTIINSVVATESGTLTKDGTGTLTLTGANTYTGATTVSEGTLLINGDQSTATGAIDVASGATLGGTGKAGGAVTVNGSLATGTVGTIGSLETGAVSFETGSDFKFNLNSDSSSAGLLIVNGGVTLANGVDAVTLSITDIGATELDEGTTFSVINYTGTAWTSNFFTFEGKILNEGDIFKVGLNRYQIFYAATSGGVNSEGETGANYVNITVIPEPSGLVVLLGTVLGLTIGPRRRKAQSC